MLLLSLTPLQIFCLELLSVSLALTVILLNAQQKSIGWLLNLLKKGFSFFVFYQKTLYIKCTLDILLGFKSLYGWYQWKHKDRLKDTEKSITTTRLPVLIGIGITCILGGLLLGKLYNTYTHCSFPYVDGLHAALVLATYSLMAQKKLEAWPIWMVANSLYIPVCWYKGMYLFTFKYVAYLVAACYGYMKWHRLEKGGFCYQKKMISDK